MALNGRKPYISPFQGGKFYTRRDKYSPAYVIYKNVADAYGSWAQVLRLQRLIILHKILKKINISSVLWSIFLHKLLSLRFRLTRFLLFRRCIRCLAFNPEKRIEPILSKTFSDEAQADMSKVGTETITPAQLLTSSNPRTQIHSTSCAAPSTPAGCATLQRLLPSPLQETLAASPSVR
jgi:hypothetical protein